LDLVEQARFDSAFTFQYSLRPGTEAATMPDQVPPDVVKDRFQRLLKLQERISLEANRALVGTEVELLVEQSTSKTNPTRMSGRTRTNKLCHFPAATVEGPGGFGEPGASGLLRDPAGRRRGGRAAPRGAGGGSWGFRGPGGQCPPPRPGGRQARGRAGRRRHRGGTRGPGDGPGRAGGAAPPGRRTGAAPPPPAPGEWLLRGRPDTQAATRRSGAPPPGRLTAAMPPVAAA